MGQPTRQSPPYPVYSRAERIADGVVHALGISASLVGTVVLFAMLAGRLGGGTLAALIVYSAALVLMLSASGAYHFGAYTRFRPVLRRLDHAAIYLKIAGTFTPLAVLIGSGFGYGVLAIVWAVALTGATRKLIAKPGRMPDGWLPYVALGWIGVMLLAPLTAVAPTQALLLIAAGGLIYTAGVPFFRCETLRFSNAVWHGFVLVATACFFAGIATSVVALS